MIRSRASHLSLRAALATFVLLAAAMPAAAASPDVEVTSVASPFSVTQGLPVAYPVTVSNGSHTLNHVVLRGLTSVSLQYLGATPTGACSQTAPVCDFGQMRNGEERSVTFYFLAPSSPGAFVFTAVAEVSEGGSDNPGAGHQDTFSAPVDTTVLEVNQDLVRGHSFAGFRSFTTGLGNLSATNKHGTTAVVPTNAEVTLRDLPATDSQASCSGLVGAVSSLPCFGEASHLAIGGGVPVPAGIKVTLRWDVTDLPAGMTEKKVQIVHVFDPGVLVGGSSYELVTAQCTFQGGVPTNMPCLDGAPKKLGDKDIQAVLYLLRNGTVRGW